MIKVTSLWSDKACNAASSKQYKLDWLYHMVGVTKVGVTNLQLSGLVTLGQSRLQENFMGIHQEPQSSASMVLLSLLKGIENGCTCKGQIYTKSFFLVKSYVQTHNL